MGDSLATASSTAPDSDLLNHLPVATLRIQLRSDFGLARVAALVPYLARLGISDIYLSPLFRSREQSSHGYDVVDHNTIDPDFGDEQVFQRLAEDARARGMGILLDAVPNHMGVNDPGNAWWIDVLENGETSQFASYFDIDWEPAAHDLRHKLLLPFLGDQFGSELEAGKLQLCYEQQRLKVAYYERRFPLAPPSWPLVLEVALKRLGENTEGEARCELESIITQLRHLPLGDRRDAEATAERYREQHVARRRLARLVEQAPAVHEALHKAIQEINGEPGAPTSFDRLEQLLDLQWYRLAFWRVAADEINYRRFFDVNDLAAIRVEDPRVFEATHRLISRLLARGWISGLRIDHPDGLLDPQQYFGNLQSLYHRESADSEDRQLYIVAEKILSADEELPDQWPVAGTTGYEFLNWLNRLLVNRDGLERLRESYPRLSGVSEPPQDLLYHSKKTIVYDVMSSEVHLLASQLRRIAQRHRWSRDFTLQAILRAVREVIACFPVYRTYAQPHSWEVHEEDYRRVTAAIRLARRRNPTMPWSLFSFVSSVLLLEYPSTVSEPDAEAWRAFLLKFQQVTGPVTAKGLEDTAFYRYYPLASLNEVGGQLDAEPLAAEEFHRLMRRRNASWPHSLSATATHDTKRGEDVRARLHVLSEVPDAWAEAVEAWRALNRPLLRTSDGDEIPGRNEQYLLYQTLVGTWPLESLDDTGRASYTERIGQYLLKALREAKVHTSWMNPEPEYEQQAVGFVHDLLAPESAQFQQQLGHFVAEIADAGFINSLTQLILKGTLPGVPDVYQGTELWDFSLVDPDNRRPVDFDRREQMLAALEEQFARDPRQLAQELRAAWPDPRVKMFVLWRMLQLRQRRSRVFGSGDYLPLQVAGTHAARALAFARRDADQWTVVVVPLHVQPLTCRARDAQGSPLALDWQDTFLELPGEAPRRWRHELSGQWVDMNGTTSDGSAGLPLGQLLQPLPVAILSSNDATGSQ